MLTEKMAAEIPQLARGIVWCTTCGRSKQVNSSAALSQGWPKCCGYTMTIDSPEERAALAQEQGGSDDGIHRYQRDTHAT